MTSPNAPLLQRTNALKETASEELLSEAQDQAFEEIRQHREEGERFINLCGPRDVGKTFLCWVMSHTDEWEYHQAVPESVGKPAAIYDHGGHERMDTRRLRNSAIINGVACVVYVTQKPAEEVYPRVELRPEQEHYETVRENWGDLGLETAVAPSM